MINRMRFFLCLPLIGFLFAAPLPATAGTITFGGSTLATQLYLPPDGRALFWYYSPQFNANMYAYQSLAGGSMTGSNILGFASLAGVDPSTVNFTFGALPLQSLTSAANNTVTEYYAGGHWTLNAGGVVVTGINLTMSVVTDTTTDRATGFGRASVVGPTNSPLYQEIMEQTRGSGLLSFTIKRFNPVGSTDPQVFLTEGTLATIPSTAGTLGFNAICKASNMGRPWYMSTRYGQLYCYERLSEGRGTISSAEGFSSLAALPPGTATFTFDSMPLISNTHTPNNTVTEFYRGANFTLTGPGLNVAGTNFMMSAVTDKATDRAIAYGQVTLSGPTNDLFYQEVKTLTRGSCIVTFTVYDFSPVGFSDPNWFLTIGAYNVPLCNPRLTLLPRLGAGTPLRIQTEGGNVPFPNLSVEVSTNLTVWTTLITNLNASFDPVISDPSFTNSLVRFYRTVARP
jgi:hypothetical protein